MTAKELTLAGQLLDLAADEFGNWPDGWTKEEKQAFVKEFHEWNGDPEEYDPEYLELSDDSVMRFLARKLTGQVQ